MRKPLIYLLCMMITVSLFALPAAAQEAPRDTEKAEALRELGLFYGVGDEQDGTPRFELDRSATRTEALVMLIRVLGKDSLARSAEKTHPFTDVAGWADGYISYAYEQGLTKGVSSTLLGSNDEVTREQYLTMLLRALGYSDSEQGDFSWDSPYALARWKGILPEEAEGREFMRGEIVSCTCAALFASVKDSDRLLWEQLAQQNVFSEQQLKSVFPDNPFPTLRGAGFTKQNVIKYETHDEALQWIAEMRSMDVGGFDTDICTVWWGKLTGLPRHDARLYLIYKKTASGPDQGTVVQLPLAMENAMGGGMLPDDITLDGLTLTYSYSFDEPFISNAGETERKLREAGEYVFTVDLASGRAELAG